MAVIHGLEWTFDTVAAEYDRMRPAYVDELYDDIFRYQPLDKKSRVLEVGIGTGQATLPILNTGCALTAVELGRGMAAFAREKFRDQPCFQIINERFEDYQGPISNFDLIYSASAFHWIPEAVGYPKVFELLKNGGTFARFANHPNRDRNRSEIHEEFEKIYAKYLPGSVAAPEYTMENARDRAEVARAYGFSDIEYRIYHRTRDFSADDYVRLLGTYSDHIAIKEATRRLFFNEIRQAINDHGGTISIYDTIDLELARKP